MKVTIDLENGSPVQDFMVDMTSSTPIVGVPEAAVEKVEAEVAAVDAELKADEVATA